jgi:alanyl-tRNA synthetase
MTSQQIREAFLDFFAQKNHKIIKSSSLLPKDDPTILFTNAGMNQFKSVFLGLEKRSYKRATSCQKCLRVSGKHNDLETVGKTNKHHTFFEMLGNFSFGDYFKTDACRFAWELVTEVFKLDPEKSYITIYEEDEEAFKIWNEVVGIPAGRIFRFGKKDNYWAMGDTGPCGPCSEIHYDLDPKLEEGDAYSLIEKGSDRFLEIWNLVFMQFNQDKNGCLTPLPRPSIDTGMGLERMAAVLQKKNSNWDTDLFRPLIGRVGDLAQREYPAGDKGDISVRIIADHIRAITFLIGDGIMPSNEGRGYVLRRLIRRAFRHGNLIGIDKPFLYGLVGGVVDIMKKTYPELRASAQYISRVCLSEEERFALTLSSGLRYFNQFVAESQVAGKSWLSGPQVFKLYDTFGFPLDLSQELAAEQNMEVDEKGFAEELEKQRELARQSWKGDIESKEKRVYESLKDLCTRFVGYESETLAEAEALALVRDGRLSDELKAGETGELVLDQTPFYAEAGGQVGDAGLITNPHFSGLVENAFYPIPGLISHKIKVIAGKLRVGDKVDAAVDGALRKAISRNHTATHLLHASLRQILGDHVKQAGSLVAANRFRFDFTHFSPLSKEEIQKVEFLVNQKIREDIPVETRITTLDEGLREGAIAIFEEKYGEKVRLVRVGDFSRELCGGVHVTSTGQIGLFKILSETSVAAGMRRIEAITGEEAFREVEETESLLKDIQQALNSSRRDILSQIGKLKEDLKDKEREIKSLRLKWSREKRQNEVQKVVQVKGISVLSQRVDGLNNTELRDLADSLKQKIGTGVVCLGTAEEEKAFLVVAVSKDLTGRLKAGDLIRDIAPAVGGGGGGRPDFAQAGGGKPEGLDEALERIFVAVEKAL